MGLNSPIMNNFTTFCQTKLIFAHPYALWQKGRIENANGVMRRYVPKKTLSIEYSHRDIQQFAKSINDIPRRCLDGFTALKMFEVFHLEKNPQFLHILRFNSVALAV
jgi:IS30 family transposase